MHHYDVVTRRAVFRNADKTSSSRCHPPDSVRAGKVVQRACSFTVDFESTSTPFYLLQLSGSWGRERYVTETKLTHGMQSFGSMRGRGSTSLLIHYLTPCQPIILSHSPSLTHPPSYIIPILSHPFTLTLDLFRCERPPAQPFCGSNNRPSLRDTGRSQGIQPHLFR